MRCEISTLENLEVKQKEGIKRKTAQWSHRWLLLGGHGKDKWVDDIRWNLVWYIRLCLDYKTKVSVVCGPFLGKAFGTQEIYVCSMGLKVRWCHENDWVGVKEINNCPNGSWHHKRLGRKIYYRTTEWIQILWNSRSFPSQTYCVGPAISVLLRTDTTSPITSHYYCICAPKAPCCNI